MADIENHVSMLPQPTRSGAIFRALQDVTTSDENTRNAIPAPTTGHKRQGSNLSEPPSKRKTLAERAGEPIKPILAAPKSYNSIGENILARSNTQAYRSVSSSSASSYKSASISSRSTSYSGSVATGIKPPTQSISAIARPKTALARDRSTRSAESRPITSLGQHGGSHEIVAAKKAIDVDEHYKDFKRMFEDAQHLYKETLGKVSEAKDESSIYKSAINKLEDERSNQNATIISLSSESETLKYRLEAAEKALVEQLKSHESQIEKLEAQHRRDVEMLRQDQRDNAENLKSDHRNDLKEIKQKYEVELEQERNQRIEALSQVSTQGLLDRQKHQMELEMKEHDIRIARSEVERIANDLGREKTITDDLRKSLADAGNHASDMETGRLALQKKIEYLESDNKTQSEAYAQMEKRMNEAIQEAHTALEKLRKEETLRRKLHNQVQELKGNIRVFCRVRPTLPSGEPEELAKMSFPDMEDSKEIEVKGQDETSSLGKVTTKTHPFTFDRVFDPASNNQEIFDEISQLIQSALDGYNVCIFAYGQTGSGKTYTMSSDDGMIPRALRQIYNTSKDLEERGWKYSMEGSFVEVYNEDLRDLLGKEGENKKHDIRHDPVKCETTVTDVTTVQLENQDQVEEILTRAMAKRSVAATKANERSSRSHSVFILKLVGENSITGERSKGTLNLVDLAGSERISLTGVQGARLKETQSINKSLSCLGDVISALGQQGVASSDPKSSTIGSSSAAGAHIPYRNSKLTYLLQYSLGGNSKTLMFVMVAPEKKCLAETITSLKFAEKVSKTKIGVAKKIGVRT